MSGATVRPWPGESASRRPDGRPDPRLHQLRKSEVGLVGMIAFILVIVSCTALDTATGTPSATGRVTIIFAFGGITVLVVLVVLLIALCVNRELRVTGRLRWHLFWSGALLGLLPTVVTAASLLTGELEGVVSAGAIAAIGWGAPILARLVLVPATARVRPELFAIAPDGRAARRGPRASAARAPGEG